MYYDIIERNLCVLDIKVSHTRMTKTLGPLLDFASIDVPQQAKFIVTFVKRYNWKLS